MAIEMDQDDHVVVNEQHPLAQLLQQLIRQQYQEDRVVQFVPFAMRGEAGDAFTPDRNPTYSHPVIRVHREHAMRPGKTRDELITLAHEAGHLDSWRDGHHSPEYCAARDAFDAHLETFGQDARGALGEDLALLVLEEEKRAWANARARLTTLGFSDWCDFDEHERLGLEAYRDRFAA